MFFFHCSGASGDSPAFLRVLAEMSADATAAAAAATNRDGGSGSGSGNGGSGDAGGGDGAGRHSGDQGTALSKIDDPDAFHLKTVRTRV